MREMDSIKDLFRQVWARRRTESNPVYVNSIVNLLFLHCPILALLFFPTNYRPCEIVWEDNQQRQIL